MEERLQPPTSVVLYPVARSDDHSPVSRFKTTGAVFAFWFLLAIAAVGLLQLSQARATGGIGGLLKVGDQHSVSELIESEIPGIPKSDDIGHDGQLFYVIGLDLRGEWVPAYLDPFESVPYRYRRIAYPALSSLLGLSTGPQLLWGMVIVNLISVGVASGSVAVIARHLGKSPLLASAVVLNPGVWLSAQLLTADNLALAAGLAAILAFLKDRLPISVVALAVAALAKEVAVVFAVGLAGYAWFQGWRVKAVSLAVGSVIPLGLWLLYVHMAIGNVIDSSGNIGPPFAGLVDAAAIWPDQTLRENGWTFILITFIVLGIVGLIRSHAIWRWTAWPWIGVALVSSHLVWDLGNNSIRTLSPIIVLTVLGLADRTRRPSTAKEPDSPVTSPVAGNDLDPSQTTLKQP